MFLITLVLLLLSQNIITQQCYITSPDSKGPFYIPGAPNRTTVCEAEPGKPRFELTTCVYDSDCVTPLPWTTLDIWQANTSGLYSPRGRFECRAKTQTNETGCVTLKTIVPGRYPIGFWL